MKQTRKLFKALRGKRAIILVAAVLVASLAAAMPGMAEPRETMLKTEANAVNNGDGSWVIDTKVSNVGGMPALPGIKVALVARDKAGTERVIEEFARKGALPSGRSFAHSFTANAGDDAELFVTAKARNSAISASEAIPVPISPIIVLGLVLTSGLFVWNAKNRLNAKPLTADAIHA